MDNWNHLAVVAVERSNAAGELRTVDSDGREQLIDNQDAGLTRTMRLLGELGRDGWQLVSTEHFAQSTEFLRFYWLKQPGASSGGGFAYGA